MGVMPSRRHVIGANISLPKRLYINQHNNTPLSVERLRGPPMGEGVGQNLANLSLYSAPQLLLHNVKLKIEIRVKQYQ